MKSEANAASSLNGEIERALALEASHATHLSRAIEQAMTLEATHASHLGRAIQLEASHATHLSRAIEQAMTLEATHASHLGCAIQLEASHATHLSRAIEQAMTLEAIHASHPGRAIQEAVATVDRIPNLIAGYLGPFESEMESLAAKFSNTYESVQRAATSLGDQMKAIEFSNSAIADRFASSVSAYDRAVEPLLAVNSLATKLADQASNFGRWEEAVERIATIDREVMRGIGALHAYADIRPFVPTSPVRAPKDEPEKPPVAEPPSNKSDEIQKAAIADAIVQMYAVIGVSQYQLRIWFEAVTAPIPDPDEIRACSIELAEALEAAVNREDDESV